MTAGFGNSTTYHLDLNEINSATYEMGPIRPPSEGQDRSLLIRVSRNCPWNQCLFCSTYRGKKFEYRPLTEVKRDIDIAKQLADGLRKASFSVGEGGTITQRTVEAVVAGTPEVFSETSTDKEELMARFQCLSNVATWLNSGAKTVFFQDGNSIIMRASELVSLLNYLREVFPSVERVTSYGRARTVAQRSLEDLRALHSAGLSRLHLGMESGCNEVLAFMQKGVTADDLIKGGQKVVASGISLSQYIMPGLGGRRWSEKHALDSANVLNQINPDFIRLRSLVVRPNLLLHEKVLSDEFHIMSEDEMIDEIGLFIENLEAKSYLVSDQMSNLLWELEGKIPDEKDNLLSIIRRYKSMLPLERLSFVLGRRARSFMGVHGEMDSRMAAVVEEAVAAIQAERPDAEAKTNRAVSALKSGFV